MRNRQSRACPCSGTCQADCLQNASSLTRCKRSKSIGKEGRQCSGAAKTCLFLCLPHILPLPAFNPSPVLRRQPACLQNPEHTDQTPSFSWPGAAWWTPGLIRASSKFYTGGINIHLAAGCVRGRISPLLEPDMRPIMPTHSLQISFTHMWVPAGGARPGEITQPIQTLACLAKIRRKQSNSFSTQLLHAWTPEETEKT